MTPNGNVFGRAIGRLDRLRLHAQALKQSWIRGYRASRRLYPAKGWRASTIWLTCAGARRKLRHTQSAKPPRSMGNIDVSTRTPVLGLHARSLGVLVALAVDCAPSRLRH